MGEKEIGKRSEPRGSLETGSAILSPPHATAGLASLADIFPIWPRFLTFSPNAEPNGEVTGSVHTESFSKAVQHGPSPILYQKETVLVSLPPIRSSTHIRVVARYKYGISALVPPTSFRGETVGGVAKCLLFFLAYQKSGVKDSTCVNKGLSLRIYESCPV